MKKRIMIGLVLIAVIGISLAIKGKRSAENESVQVWETVEISRGDISSFIAGRGKVNPRRVFSLYPARSNKIQEVMVREGNRVKKGECLVKMEPDPQLDMEWSNTKRSIFSLQEDKKDLEKKLILKKKLFQEGLAARLDVEDLERTVEKQGAKIENLTKRLGVLEEKMGFEETGRSVGDTGVFCLNAPFAGTVLQVNSFAGDMARPRLQGAGGREGLPILVLADTSEYLVKYEISELDLGKIKKGQQVDVRFDSYPLTVCEGKVDKISTVASEVKGFAGNKPKQTVAYYNVDIILGDCPVALKPGLSCQVEIEIDRHPQALLVPLDSVFREGGNHFVFLLQGKEYVRTPIETGITNEDKIEILGGLSEGDIICENPLHFLEEMELNQRQLELGWLERIFQ